MKQDTVSINLRLPKALHAALKQKAKEQTRSLNGQIVRALGVFMFGDQNLGDPIRPPSSDARHQCGLFCDGQDGASSQCAQEQRKIKRKRSK